MIAIDWIWLRGVLIHGGKLSGNSDERYSSAEIKLILGLERPWVIF